MGIKEYYCLRFSKKDKIQKEKIWKYLCMNFLQSFIKKDASIVDIGAGYCEFINNINAKKKIAVDINPDVKLYAKDDVEVILCPADKISDRLVKKVDYVFLSNFLEHLNSKEEVLKVLNAANNILKNNGHIMILQPNIDLVKEKYWDFIDHKIPLNIASIIEALNITGFVSKKVIKRFLPYSTKSCLPKGVFLMSLYLKLPEFLRPFSGQSFIYAQKVSKVN